jgi:hypothetical protein
LGRAADFFQVFENQVIVQVAELAVVSFIALETAEWAALAVQSVCWHDIAFAASRASVDHLVLRAAGGDVGVDQFSIWSGVFAFVLGVSLFAFQWAAFANEVLCVQSCGAIILSLNLRAVRRDSGVIRGVESCDGETEESLIFTRALRANHGANLAVGVHILVFFEI